MKSSPWLQTVNVVERKGEVERGKKHRHLHWSGGAAFSLLQTCKSCLNFLCIFASHCTRSGFFVLRFVNGLLNKSMQWELDGSEFSTGYGNAEEVKYERLRFSKGFVVSIPCYIIKLLREGEV
jgi:hypothetical protein